MLKMQWEKDSAAEERCWLPPKPTFELRDIPPAQPVTLQCPAHLSFNKVPFMQTVNSLLTTCSAPHLACSQNLGPAMSIQSILLGLHITDPGKMNLAGPGDAK